MCRTAGRVVHRRADARQPGKKGRRPLSTYGIVESTEQLTPNLIRVVFGGEGLVEFTPTEWTDQYVNARFLPDGVDYAPPFDLDEVLTLPREQRPVGRRYTVRSWNAEARQLTMDFVVHGDIGHAGRWAHHARPGDRLQFTGPSGGYRPDPAADAHLFAGDESALPAIAASLEVLPAGARAYCVLVVDDADGELPLVSPGDLHLSWLHRVDAAPGDPDQLLRGVQAVELPAGRTQVFVHGEAYEVRSIRKHLVGDRGIPKEDASISPYWRRGKNDEQWRQVKRDWITASDDELEAALAGSGEPRPAT